MAYRSKLSQIVIDCADLHGGLAFWGGALGLPAAAATIEWPYGTLGDINGLHIVVQRVPEPKAAKNRMHLDIETDDIEMEARRLEALGARRVEEHEGWCLRVPAATVSAGGGLVRNSLRFCSVGPGGLPAKAAFALRGYRAATPPVPGWHYREPSPTRKRRGGAMPVGELWESCGRAGGGAPDLHGPLSAPNR